MADNIVESLFGPQPWQIQQQQYANLGVAADKYASQDPFQRAAGQMFRGGGMLGGVAAEGMGYVNPAAEQAKLRESVMSTGGDLTTSAGLKAKAAQFAQAGDQQTAMKLIMLAKQQEAKEQEMLMASRKQALGERKQEFQETEAFDLKKTEAMERLRLREKEIESQAAIAKQRGEDLSQYRNAMIENRQAMLALAQSKQQGASGLGKPPAGYRYTADGNLEPIPGGPKDMTAKNKAISDTTEMKSKLVIQKVDEALKETGFFSTGLTGEVLGMIPGTKAYDLDATLDTIKANLGFNELQAMRQASPTGGALGQVAVRELEMLQATIASLKKGQSQAKLRNGLNQVKMHYGNWKKAVDQSAAQEGGAPISGGKPTGSAVDAALEKYK
jgi:hypothetical protein